MLILRKLQYLVALAREKHFARAAAACYVTQPTLSVGIQQLEIDLGVQIIKRGRKFEGLTEAGELVLASARRMTVESDRLREELKQLQGNQSGTLRIGVLASTIPLMKLYIQLFHRRYPTMNINVSNHDPFEIQQGLEDGSLDVAITYLDDNASYGASRVLYTEEYELLIRRGGRFSGEASVEWEAIKELPLCLLVPNPRVFGAEESEFLQEAMTKTTTSLTTSIWMVMDLVRTGEWASVLPRPVLAMITDDSELEAIPLVSKGTPSTVGIILPREGPPLLLAEEFFAVVTSPESIASTERLLRRASRPIASQQKTKPDKAQQKKLSSRRAI